MKKSVPVSRVMTAVVSFVVGLLVASIGWCLVIEFRHSASKPVRVRIRENKQATAFFYRTASALFEGTYNSEDGSISEHALNKFRKNASNSGNKCYAEIYDNESGYHWGAVFFPSGDIFEVILMPHSEQGFVITEFAPMDWDNLWGFQLKRALPKPDEES